MTSFQGITAAMIVRDATALQQHYENDLEENFPEEFEHIEFELNLKDDEGEPMENPSVKMLYKILIDKKLVSTFPNVEVAMRIYLSLIVSNATGERTFSKLKLIKSEKRTCMVQSRLTCLSLMSIENELLKNLDCEEIIDRFARAKCRKNPM